MLRAFVSVSGFTLLSRVSGFVRDIAFANVVGAGAVMDALAVAQRLPNHLRTIFAEGAFSAAYVPAVTRIRSTAGADRADRFSGELFTLLLAASSLVTLLAILFTPQLLALITSGFGKTPGRDALTVQLTRITFPYLVMITIVTLWSGALNAVNRFAVAAAASVLLNLCLLASLGLAGFFETAGHAAAWGIYASGVLQLLLLAFAAARAGVLATPRWPSRNADLGGFFSTFGPAVIGSAGVQIAMLVDTSLAYWLPGNAPSLIYYADRIFQLPIGLIAVAAGTVLLPEMSRRLAEGDEKGAFAAQNRLVGLNIALTAPFFVAFLLLPDLIVSAAFRHGAFDVDAAHGSATVLLAYGLGLPAAVLIRAAVAGFQARGDTRTPMAAALLGVAANVALKFVLTSAVGVSGLALATSGGVWINLGLLVVIGLARGSLFRPMRPWRG